MGYIAGALALIGTVLLAFKQYKAGFVVWSLAGLFGWGSLMTKS